MLILSDGADTASTNTLASAQACLATNSIKAFLVGLGTSVDNATLQAIADASGGLYSPVSAAAGLTAVFDAIALAVNSGYNTMDLVIDPTLSGTISIIISIEGGPNSSAFTFAL